MFLDRHPDRPGKETTLKHLGYWHSVKLDPKGEVHGTGMSYDNYEAQGGLPLPSDFVDESWSSEERATWRR